MWLMPSSTARRSTLIDRSRLLGVPRPSRLTVRSASFRVPAAAAVIVSEVMAEAFNAAFEPPVQQPGSAPQPMLTADPPGRDRRSVLALRGCPRQARRGARPPGRGEADQAER